MQICFFRRNEKCGEICFLCFQLSINSLRRALLRIFSSSPCICIAVPARCLSLISLQPLRLLIRRRGHRPGHDGHCILCRNAYRVLAGNGFSVPSMLFLQCAACQNIPATDKAFCNNHSSLVLLSCQICCHYARQEEAPVFSL